MSEKVAYKERRKPPEPTNANTALDMKKKAFEASVLNSQRLAKQRLKTFSAGKGGTISFGINKVQHLG